MGADLPIIKSSAENTFILDLVKKQKTVTDEGGWLGLQRKNKTSKLDFYWIDGSPLEKQAYQNWAKRQPDLHGGYEHCGHMYGRNELEGEWNDFPCNCSSANCPVVLCQMSL